MSSRGGPPVPFFDWKALYAERADDYGRILLDAAAGGRFILHDEVDAFEEALAGYLGVRHVVGLSDCTNAMLLGLRALGLEPGAEVILPAHGFIAAAQSIHFAGLTPVPADICESERLIDPESVRRAITPRTRAIMAVHVNGRVSPMDQIAAIVREHDLVVVEDAAQALGASLWGRPAGRFGAWGAFSFYPSKTLGCFGDAGALVTDDDDIAATVRATRNHGADSDRAIGEDISVWGTNARLDNLHAAILAFKLGWYGETIARRRAIAARYAEAFADLSALDLPPGPDATDRFDIFQNFEVCCDHREALRTHLASRGIGSIVQWGGTGLHQFRNLGLGRDLPHVDRFFRRCLLLPMNHLLSDSQVGLVIDAVRDFFA